MSIQLCIYDLIALLLFSLQYIQVTRSKTELDTWINAVLDCNNKNVYLESNDTIIKNYITTHNDVNSLWVGRFEALLPWIEIRGCYNILQTCNSKEKDEKVAKNSAMCQLKCMKRQYFAFNQNNQRCVCFDEYGIVMQPSENSSLCRMCEGRSDCNSFAVTYKVVNRSISDAKNENDACLSYRCNRGNPIFSESDCYNFYCKPYCRNIQRAVVSVDLPFYDHLKACEENHFSYPLLISENSVQLCDIPESDETDNWVGVFRQTLSADDLDKTVQQFYNEYFKNIKKCYYLTPDGSFINTEDCGEQLHHYICTEDTPMESQKEPYKISTSSPICRTEGIIVGIVISISVIVVIICLILAFMYHRTYSKEQLSLNTVGTCGRKDRSTNDMDDDTVISDYQQLDNVDAVQKMTQAYDQLHVPCNITTNDQTNTSFSREECSKYESIVELNEIHTNTVISEYEVLHNAEKDTSTQAYDQLNVTRAVKTDPNTFFKNESTKATTASSEYEQLDNAKKDKSANVYDQLHVTDIIDNEQTNYNSMTTKSRDQQSNVKPTEETTKLNNITVTSEYEHLDNATKDKSVNVYDQLNDTDVMENDPTHHNPCQ